MGLRPIPRQGRRPWTHYEKKEMTLMNSLQAYNVRSYRGEVSPEAHDTAEARKLKESCQQFESILWAQMWKKMKANARALGGNTESRPWGPLEDLSVEMASEELAKSGGSGLWKILYDQMVTNLAPAKTEDAKGNV
jgi:Rod binding domain-containing protein